MKLISVNVGLPRKVRELEREICEGTYHPGVALVVRFIDRKEC